MSAKGRENLLIRIKVSQSVIINQTAAEVFAYLSDLENLLDWSGAVIAVRKISPGPMCVGATIRSTTRFLGRWSDITFEIVEYKPGRYLTIKSLSGATPCLFCYQFDARECGNVNVSLEAVLHFTEGILGLEASVVKNLVRGQIEHDLQTLKAMLEASKVADGSAV